MYFADFQSFTQTHEDAKSFVVEVELLHGGVEVGSPVPKESFTGLLTDIAACEEVKSSFALWTRDGTKGGSLSFIPYDNIKVIRVRFIM